MKKPARTRPPSARQPVLHPASAEPVDPALEVLVREIIGRVADKWTMLALEALAEHGRLRFTRCGELIGVWLWAEKHREAIQQSRQAFAKRETGAGDGSVADEPASTRGAPAIRGSGGRLPR